MWMSGQLGFGCINVFVVWVECIKALIVNVCYGTAKSVEIVSKDMRVSTAQHADCAWGRIPIYIPVCRRSFSGGLFLTQPSQQ